jgi:hypothetical protein
MASMLLLLLLLLRLVLLTMRSDWLRELRVRRTESHISSTLFPTHPQIYRPH